LLAVQAGTASEAQEVSIPQPNPQSTITSGSKKVWPVSTATHESPAKGGLFVLEQATPWRLCTVRKGSGPREVAWPDVQSARPSVRPRRPMEPVRSRERAPHPLSWSARSRQTQEPSVRAGYGVGRSLRSASGPGDSGVVGPPSRREPPTRPRSRTSSTTPTSAATTGATRSTAAVRRLGHDRQLATLRLQN
jgi:hypothetical protein